MALNDNDGIPTLQELNVEHVGQKTGLKKTGKILVHLGLPSTFTRACMIATNFIAAAFLANLPGLIGANGANGLIASIQNILLNAATSGVNATGVLIGKNYAELTNVGNRPSPQVKGQSNSISKIGQIWLHSNLFTIIFGTIFGALLALSGTLLRLIFNTSNPDNWASACMIQWVDEFMLGFSWGTPFLVLIATQQQLFFGIMKPHFAILLALLYLGLRSLLCWVLGQSMGPAGLGHGSSLAALISWVVSLGTLFLPEFRRFEMLNFRRMKKSFGLFKALCRIGIPIGAKVMVERISIVAATIMIGFIPIAGTSSNSSSDASLSSSGSYVHQCIVAVSNATSYDSQGQSCASEQVPTPSDINGIVLQFAFGLTVPILGLTQACGIAVARALGQGNRKWANQIGNVCIVIGEVVAVFVFGCYLIPPLARFLLGIFLDVGCNPEVVQTTIYILWISAGGQIFETLRNVASGGLRGYRDTLFPMIQGILWMAVINIPLTYLFTLTSFFPYGLYGVYTVRGVTVLINSIIVLLRWFWLIRDQPASYVPLDIQ